MVKLINKIRTVFNIEIIKVFSFTAVATVVKMITSFITVKVVAICVGPSGIALLGQLNNFSSIVMTGACGGINQGVTKYISSSKKTKVDLTNLISTAFRITIFCSVVCGVFLIIFSRFFSKWIMLSDQYAFVFIIFGFTLFLYALNNLVISILNGFKLYKKFVLVNIVGNICGLFFTIIFVYLGGLKGAMISAVTFQSVSLLITLWLVRNFSWASKEYLRANLNLIIASKYSKYTIMAFVSAATIPISQLILRGYVMSEISSQQAGWWEAMNKVSGMYLMVITTSLSVYYLPKLSELRGKIALREEILKSYKIIIPILLIGLFIVYFSRFILVRIIFSGEFIPMSNLFIWQLIGDFFKMSSWIISYLMVAKSLTKIFVFTEVLYNATFVALGIFFANINGIVGLTQAYAINSFFYLCLVIFIFRKILFIKKIHS